MPHENGHQKRGVGAQTWSSQKRPHRSTGKEVRLKFAINICSLKPMPNCSAYQNTARFIKETPKISRVSQFQSNDSHDMKNSLLDKRSPRLFFVHFPSHQVPGSAVAACPARMPGSHPEPRATRKEQRRRALPMDRPHRSSIFVAFTNPWVHTQQGMKQTAYLELPWNLRAWHHLAGSMIWRLPM